MPEGEKYLSIRKEKGFNDLNQEGNSITLGGGKGYNVRSSRERKRERRGLFQFLWRRKYSISDEGTSNQTGEL